MRGRLKSIELKDRGRVGAAIGYVREVREWLDHVEKSIETERPALHILPRLGELERGFHSCIKDGPECIATEVDRMGQCWIGKEEIGHQGIRIWCEDGIPEIAGIPIVSPAKANPRDDRKPAEVCAWIEKLVESIETSCVITLKTRIDGKFSSQVSKSTFAFVENRPTKKCVPLDVQNHFRQPFCLLKEIVCLKTPDRG